MTFDEVLAQVLVVLQREQRISYRALKRRFEIDDEYIEDLKAEIIQAKRLAVDEDGAVLVWTGGAETQPDFTSPQPTQQTATQEGQPTPIEPPPPEPHTPDAERRQLTVMFSDLVDSTKLSSQLDPEDYRDVVREYQQICSEVIQRYEGHIAQLLGDGLLVYFGYPVAHEEDAQRAIHAGLGILDAIKALNTSLTQEKDVQLAIRLGIHTGLVVIGEMGGEGRQEQLALGEVPNVAARIQGLAKPDTVMISDATYRLIQGYFDCQELGAPILRGVSQPLPVYRVLQASGIQSRLEVASTRGLTPLVGRESEVTSLLECWDQAKDGQGQVILLSGEAGIGKSRLVQVLKDHLADEPHIRWECRSSPYYQNSALYPIIDLIQRTLRWRQDDTQEEKQEKLERTLSQYRLPLEESVSLFAPLLSLPVPEERYPPLNLSPQRQRQKTLEAIVSILLEQAEQQPVLFILEDLHWTDPSTLEFLDLLLDQPPTASIFTMLTCRPEFQPSWHHRSSLTEVALNRLSRYPIEQMVERVAGGKTLPADVVHHIVEKTDGVPLFVEEMVKAVLESGILQDVDGQYEVTGSLSTLAIPATLQDALMARLDRLVSAKGIAQLGAVMGRQFSYELLQAVSQGDEVMLQHELRRLVEAELLHQRGLPPLATYTFKHALIQDAAYQSLLKSARQQYHQRIAQVLEQRFPETAENQPEVLAHHYTAAGRTEQAIGYWQQAGQQAIERSANAEAIAHLTQGLTVLQDLPETPARQHQELAFQVALGPALIAIKGYAVPEVERTYARAQELCEQVGNTPQLFAVLRGLSVYYVNRGDLQMAYQLGEQLLRLAQSQPDPAYLLLAHYMLGQILFYRGEPAAAQTHLAQALAIYTPQEHQSLAVRYGLELGSASGSYLALGLGLLGYIDQAMQRIQATRTLAQEVSHPYSLDFTLVSAAILHQFRRETSMAYEQATAAMALATEQAFANWSAWGMILHGWARAMQGQYEEGMAQIRQGLAAEQATGLRAWQPYFLGLLAEAYGEGGHPEAGLSVLAEALAIVDTTEVRFYAAELFRLQGTLLLSQAIPDVSQAETCFHQALDIAHAQQAKSWELRAATGLARLWQSQGKHQDAYELLAPVYGWFTEGFDTADLKDAKALLDDLS